MRESQQVQSLTCRTCKLPLRPLLPRPSSTSPSSSPFPIPLLSRDLPHLTFPHDLSLSHFFPLFLLFLLSSPHLYPISYCFFSFLLYIIFSLTFSSPLSLTSSPLVFPPFCLFYLFFFLLPPLLVCFSFSPLPFLLSLTSQTFPLYHIVLFSSLSFISPPLLLPFAPLLFSSHFSSPSPPIFPPHAGRVVRGGGAASTRPASRR